VKISAKTRYGLAALVYMADNAALKDTVTIAYLSEALDISKIYLEQVFSLLKRGGIVTSIKGSQGGYRLSRRADMISIYDVFTATETLLLENTEDTVRKSNENIEKAMKEAVFDVLDEAIRTALKKISLGDILNRTGSSDSYMYFGL